MLVLKELISAGWNLMDIKGIGLREILTLFISAGKGLSAKLARWRLAVGILNSGGCSSDLSGPGGIE